MSDQSDYDEQIRQAYVDCMLRNIKNNKGYILIDFPTSLDDFEFLYEKDNNQE